MSVDIRRCGLSVVLGLCVAGAVLMPKTAGGRDHRTGRPASNLRPSRTGLRRRDRGDPYSSEFARSTR